MNKQPNDVFENQPYCHICDQYVASCPGHGNEVHLSVSGFPQTGRVSLTNEEAADMLRRTAPYAVSLLHTVDPVTVGDLGSDARGSGARKSAGKPDWSQFPIWTIAEIIEWYSVLDDDHQQDETARIDVNLGQWQRGEDRALDRAAVAVIRAMEIHENTKDIYEAFSLVVRVLEFGQIKYKRGNWARGMPWSVCYNSAVSHLMKFIAGRKTDEESGLSHLAHLLCNLLFLIAYRDLYPEGDDRMVEFKGATSVYSEDNDVGIMP